MRHCIRFTYNVKLACTRSCYRNLVYAPFGKFQIFCNSSDILTCPPDIHISYSNILTWPAAHLISSSDILTCPLSSVQPLALDHSHLLPDNQWVSRFHTIAAKWVSRYPTNYPVFQYDCCTFISKSTVEYPIWYERLPTAVHRGLQSESSGQDTSHCIIILNTPPHISQNGSNMFQHILQFVRKSRIWIVSGAQSGLESFFDVKLVEESRLKCWLEC